MKINSPPGAVFAGAMMGMAAPVFSADRELIVFEWAEYDDPALFRGLHRGARRRSDLRFFQRRGRGVPEIAVRLQGGRGTPMLPVSAVVARCGPAGTH